jgi:soluble lytic murein transglycosylase-like protein
MRRAIQLGIGLLFGIASISLQVSAATPTPEAASATDTPPLPRVLSDTDADLYNRIFLAQIDGKWKQADRLSAKLSDRRLLGHVRHQRYMHPTAYRSRYPELHHWLLAYADHPGAERIYKLAKQRHLKNWKRPTAPKRPVISKQARRMQDRAAVDRKKPSPGARKIRLPRWLRVNIHSYLRRGRPDLADKYIHSKKVRRAIGTRRLDRARSLVATGYLRAGKDQKALDLATMAAKRSRDRVPSADRIAGLAAWRAGLGDRATHHFSQLARSETAGGRNRAAGAYWAARTLLRGGDAQQVRQFLELAAAHPRTLHGLLACRQLAMTPDLQWQTPVLDDEQLAALMTLPAVQRAVALSEAGRPHLADAELGYLRRHAPPGVRRALFGLAVRLPAPAVALRIAQTTLSNGGPYYDVGLYPLLSLADTEKLGLDRALIHAFVRQESHFNARARSRVGARGLMQILPSTASFVGADRSLKWSKRANLYDPAVNLDLGDKYLAHLLTIDPINGDLIRLVAAYNGGPGNLRKWLRRMGQQTDPLFFLETIPSRETRFFTERVLTNLWIYRLRLGQPQPSLDDLAAGRWPRYESAGGRTRPVAQN